MFAGCCCRSLGATHRQGAVCTRVFPNGDRSEEQPRKQRKQEGEGEGAGVEGDLAEPRQIGGTNHREKLQSAVGNTNGESATGKTDDDTFYQQLASDASAA